MHNLTTLPTRRAVNVSDAKQYAYVTNTDDDRIVDSLILEGTQLIENRYAIAIMSQTWTLSLDGFEDARYWRDGAIHIGRPPFGSVTSFTYLDANGVSQTLASSEYRLTSGSQIARIEPAYNVTWPSTRGVQDEVTIIHTAGKSDADDVPYVLRHAIINFVFNRYHNRGCDLDDGVMRTLDALCAGEGTLTYA